MFNITEDLESRVDITRVCSDNFTYSKGVDLKWDLEIAKVNNRCSISILILSERLLIEFENEETGETKDISYNLEDFKIKIVERKRKHLNETEIQPDEIIIYENDNTMEVYF